MSPLGIGTEAYLNGGQNGGFAAAILSVDEVDIATELHGEFAMTHKVFYGDGGDDAGFGGNVGGIGVTVEEGRVDDSGRFGGAARRGGGFVRTIFFVIVNVGGVFFGGGGALDSFGGGHDEND